MRVHEAASTMRVVAAESEEPVGLECPDRTNANLVSADLPNAYLKSANLTRVEMDRADLSGTNLFLIP